MKKQISNLDVRAAFDRFGGDAKDGALALRALIFEQADALGIQPPEECLRWGQPSYVSPMGTPLRIGTPKTGGFAIYAHCQSSVISDFAIQFGTDFNIEGNRAIHFQSIADIKPNRLRLMIAHALQYKSK